MKKFLFALCFMSSSMVLAQSMLDILKPIATIRGVTCSVDRRGADGMYTEVKVENNSGSVDVIYTRITPGFGSPVENTSVKIATNFSECAASDNDLVVMSCFKNAENGEATNSGLTIKRVREDSVTSEGKNTTKEYYSIEVFSPQLNSGKAEDGFPYTTDRLGRAQFEFGLPNQKYQSGNCTLH